MSSTPLSFSPPPPPTIICTTFRDNPCTYEDGVFYAGLGESLGLTEFDATSVNWAKPVFWGNGDNCSMDNQDGCLIPLGAGLAIILGFGLFFSVFTTFLVFLEKKFAGVEITSEHFNTAGRNVKTGLTASVIVSQWTWAATLLQSSNVAWSYGLSGPFWYAAGASIQVLLFGILAIEVKRKAPDCHTFLELVDVRWGKLAHMVFMFFALCTNILVTSMLLLGGAAVMNAVSGIDKALCSFLMPWGVILYTLAGGLKATFLASYIHTAIIMIGLVIFIMVVYAKALDCDEDNQCDQLGGADPVYERLAFITALPLNNTNGYHQGPVDGNRGGSYVTMLSSDGLMFGVINIVGNFGTVFVDQSYWQSAIAASPAAAHKGYLLGGLVWFTIPFALATSLGLAAVALNADLTTDDANAGLVPPAAASILMGDFGAYLIIIMLFMAITSTGSAECIAVSSLITYDIYRKYFNPQATGQKILFVSRIVVGVFGILMGVLAVVLNSFETPSGGTISLGWVYLFMGVVIGSAVLPISFLLTWDKASAAGAISGAIIGQIGAFIAWMVTAAARNDGTVDYDTLGQNEPMLAGNLVAILLSGLVCAVVSLIKPQNYDWEEFKRKINRVEEEERDDFPDWEMDPVFLGNAKKWILKWGWISTLILIFAWPAATVPWGVLDKSLYAVWASLAFIWGWLAAIVIIGLPILENIETVIAVITWSPVSKQPAKYSTTADGEKKESPTSAVPVSSA
mmetsp:Transcript_41469/g.91099  ORF Transcript_41469/g.91099 Transcript_41469/m.91099 type:complete len:740 (-) Transcript_41469:194-2413(-)